MPPPRLTELGDNISVPQAVELGRLLTDLTDAALHQDRDRVVNLIGTLDLQEAADVIAGLAIGASLYLHALAGHDHARACQTLKVQRAAVESGRLFE